MLTNVVDEHGATGNAAQIPGYTVAGKTGTAQKPGPNGYTTGKYVASFVGMVPVSKPRFVVLVTVDEPHGAIFGGVVAAPAFAQIAKFDLQYLGGAARRAADAVAGKPGPSYRFSSRMDLDRLIAALGTGRGGERRSARDHRPRLRHARGRAGSLFFCVPGSTVDGHDLAAAAVAAGAVALVVERRVDVAGAAAAWWRAFATRCRWRRTSSSATRPASSTSRRSPARTARRRRRSCCASILDAAGRQPGAAHEHRAADRRRAAADSGSTRPEAIDLQRLFREMLDAGDRSCAMEATSIAAAKGRLDGTRFAVLVFTNLTQDHLDFHGTMEEYFAAKRALFEQAERAVVNVGDEWGRAARRRASRRAHVHARRRARRHRPEAARRGSTARTRSVRLGGARARRRRRTRSGAGIEALAGVPGRFESVDAGQPFAVIVDYAHTPDSLENVLRAARELGEPR